MQDEKEIELKEKAKSRVQIHGKKTLRNSR